MEKTALCVLFSCPSSVRRRPAGHGRRLVGVRRFLDDTPLCDCHKSIFSTEEHLEPELEEEEEVYGAEEGKGWGEESMGSCLDMGSSSSNMSSRLIRLFIDTYSP